MTVATTVDTKRFVKRALEEGRKRQSSLTGYLHYAFEDHTSEHVIPIYENLVFILALSRSNQADSILEGRDLFLKLTEFISPEGAFGIYLHEWPQVRKPLANVRCLFPLLHVWLEYRHVIGDEARKKLDTTLDRLSSYIDSLDMPPILQLQKQVFDAVYHKKEMPPFDASICLSTKDWSEVIVIAPFLEDDITWPWDNEMNMFAGSYLHELKRTTLLDLYYGFNAREDEITPLYGALIYDFSPTSYIPTTIATKIGKWENHRSDKGMISYISRYEPESERISPGFHLWRIATKRAALVSQEARMKFSGALKEDVFVGEFEFGNISELNLFLDYVPKEGLFVNGVRATFFEIGDTLLILGYQIVFEKVSGIGRLCGHFLRGNRKAQTCPKVKSEWTAYDWQINLKALSNEGDLRIRMKVSII